MDRDPKFQELAGEFQSLQKPLLLRPEGEMVRYRVSVAALFVSGRGSRESTAEPP